MAEPSKNIQPQVHAMVNLFFVLGEGSAFLRLYTKLFILNSPGWDDWAMLAVAIINCGQHAIIYLFIEAGAGRSIGDVLAENPAAVGHMLKILFAEEMLYLLLHFFIKMSFLLFFLRLSPSTGFRRAVFAVIGLNVAVTVGSWALYCLQCTPIEAFWYPERHPGVRCLPFSLSLWLPASALIAIDWAVFLLPLSTILSLQMSTRRRVKVIAVVCTGGASVVVSCLRLVFLREFTVTTDLTYTLGSICIISAAEMEVAILAANMPGLSALYQICKGAGLYPSDSRTARGPGRSSHPSGKGYIHTCDDAESSRDDNGNKGDGNCCCGGAGGTSHRLATFSSRRLARGRAESGDDADLLYTRQDRRSEGRNPASDLKVLANISTRELVAPSDEEVSSPGPAVATKGHLSSASSSSASSRRFQSGVVVSREVVITNELRTVGEGATMDGPEMAYYRPPAWKGAVRSSSRPP